MFNSNSLSKSGGMFGVVVLLAVGTAVQGGETKDVNTLIEAGKLDEAITLLVAETDENPANEAARTQLALAYERTDQPEQALQTWRDLLAHSRNQENQVTARKGICRLRRQSLDKIDTASMTSTNRPDPFKIPMPEIEWEGLEVVEDSSYLPPIPEHSFDVPPFVYETQHFTVYTTNERLSKIVGDRAEIYLKFMLNALFGGRSWAVRFPIIMYSTTDDYVQHGGPSGSGGVTFGHITGKTRKLLLYQLRNSPGGGGEGIWKYGIESVLPHELTHAVINEFFGSHRPPQWMHEAVAGRFEQTRQHYVEAARLARSVVAGEYFRMRDLFEQEGYPQRISLFYEQSAIVVLYLFESGPEAMYVFFNELARGNSHDAACAAVLGIPEEGAVEEFERRWVDWMKLRYVKDLDITVDDTIVATVEKSTNSVFRPWVNELDTVTKIEPWRDLELDSLDGFLGVGRSLEDWSVSSGKLRCNASGERGASVLGLRMNEIAPVAVTCDVRYLGTPSDDYSMFGIAQLDADGNDTRVEALAPLDDNATHKLVCLWSDDLALYIDGKCTGRFPAHQVSGNARDVDYPLAFIAHGPVEIQNIRIGAIRKFSDEPIASDDEEEDAPREQRQRRRSRGSERRRNRPSRPGG